MIIYGSKGRSVTIGKGTFFCPKCQRRTTYKHQRVGRYFTLYFIPLIKTRNLGEFVECQSCFLTFKPEVLHISAQFEADSQAQGRINDLVSRIRNELESGVPIQTIAQGLVDAGVPEEIAMKVVFTAANGAFRKCPKCGLAFSDTSKYCSICGTELRVKTDYI